MSLLEWASHFKNIRCVLLFDPLVPPEDEFLGWLVKKHRWREVGIPPSLLRAKDRLCSKPFVGLSYPSEILRRLVQTLGDDHPLWLTEALVLALCYAAPLLCPSPSFHERLSPLLQWTLRTEGPPEGEVIRHLRIAGYVPVDSFPLVKAAYDVLRQGDREEMEALAKERASRAAEDGRKRFWRLKEVPEAPPLLSYLDLFPLLTERREALGDLLQHEEMGLVLTLTVVFFLPP